MKVQRGSVVIAKAGRDCGGHFAVVECMERDGYCLIADGKSRKLESPKKKNLKHVSFTHGFIELDGMTDRQLRKLLSTFGEKAEEDTDGC